MAPLSSDSDRAGIKNVEPTPICENGFTDLCQALQFFWGSGEQISSKSTLLDNQPAGFPPTNSISSQDSNASFVQSNDVDASNMETIQVCDDDVSDVNDDKQELNAGRISPDGEMASNLTSTNQSRILQGNPLSVQSDESIIEKTKDGPLAEHLLGERNSSTEFPRPDTDGLRCDDEFTALCKALELLLKDFPTGTPSDEAGSTKLKSDNIETHVGKGDTSEDKTSAEENSTTENTPLEENAKGEEESASKEDAPSDSSETSQDIKGIIDGSPGQDSEGAKNEHLDNLMLMMGLEEVKAQFLHIKAKVETAKRQGVDLSKEKFNVTLVGNPGTNKTTIKGLYDGFIKSLGVSGQATVSSDHFSGSSGSPGEIMKIPDYSDEELLRILARLINERFNKKMKVEEGIDGLYARILVRRVGRGRGKMNFGNELELKKSFSKLCDRQVDRLHQERRDGKNPDDFLFTRQDMIGPEPSDACNRSSAWKKLENMVGLKEVKESIRVFFDRVNYNYSLELQEKEPIKTSLNRVLLGPPGTGKTTVAKLYGQILADIGLLSSGEVVIRNPSDLISSYEGESEKRTKKSLEAARGNVLIIDDAHMLYSGSRSGSKDSYRTAIINTLVAEVQNTPGEDRCVILIGYTEQMDELFQNSNSGLASRFPLEQAFRFTNFNNDQLGQILDLKLSEQGLTATNEARDVALEMLSRARYRPNFANGAQVENLLSHAKDAYQKRVSKADDFKRTGDIVLEPRDFDANHDRTLRASKNCSLLFKDFIGRQDVIAQFQDYQQMTAGMRLHGIDPRPYIPFTFVFKGPPGTGKTTTARKVGQLFYDMGFLSTAEVVECSVSDLVAEYTGQTGPRVIKLLERALGKVLFVDEAYRLGEGRFADEAIGELVDCITKPQFVHKIIIILAGYEEDMNKLMQVNRGLRSRFAAEVIFHHMQPEDCLKLLQQCVDKLGIQIDGDSAMVAPVIKLFTQLTTMQSWANGRDVERLAGEVIRHVFKAQATKTDTVSPLTVPAEELVTFLEGMLEEAEMKEAEMAVSTTPEGHLGRVGKLNILGMRQFHRYQRTENINYLTAAISNARLAVSIIPNDNPDLAWMLYNLTTGLFCRYKQTGNIDDLTEAVSKAKLAVSITSKDDPDLPERLSNLGVILSSQYEQTGKMVDLEAAIAKSKQSVFIIPKGNPDRAWMLDNLGNDLFRRYEQTRDLDNLKAAVFYTELAISITPKNDIDLAARLNKLGVILLSRYEQTGNIADLETAISNLEQSVSIIPKGNPDQEWMLDNLGNGLFRRYERIGNLDDLKAAISKSKQLVSSISEHYLDQASMVDNFGNKQFHRYQQTKSVDFTAAAWKAKLAVSAIPKDHSTSAKMLNNFSNRLFCQYERIGNIDDFKESVSKSELSIRIIPEHHPDRACMIGNLGNRLLSKYRQTGNEDNLNAAIMELERAVSIIPKGHLNRAGLLCNLVNGLSCRYEQKREEGDLIEAVSNAKLAVSITSKDDPHWALTQIRLGDALLLSSKATEALRCFKESLQCSHAIPLVRIDAARRAIEILQERREWEEASLVAQGAVELLPIVCGRYLSREDQQHAVLQISGLAADACSISLKTRCKDQALEQIEFGRGLILGYLIDSRSDFSTLKKACPSLAAEYDALRFKASVAIDAQRPAVREQMNKERMEATSDLRDCLRRIRQQPGHERFLLPSTSEELKKITKEGPIVIVNMTGIGSDAIIVSKFDVNTLALPDMTLSKSPLRVQDFTKFKEYRAMNGHRKACNRGIGAETQTKENYVEFLSWLWSSCVELVLAELRAGEMSASGELPRIWWIGTGIASSLPFHAAGCHLKGSNKNTLSRAISSYTPTIKALAHARFCASGDTELGVNKTSVLLAAMPDTPGLEALPGVKDEILAVQKAIENVKPLEYPSVRQVLDEMRMVDIVHFACHGSSDHADPSNSHLLLQKGDKEPSVDRLTVQIISNELALGRAWIAYLSACSTAEVACAHFVDEALHLASGFQIAGFRHVISSLWSVKDDVCVRMAEYFYSSLFQKNSRKGSDRIIAEALHDAVLRVRSDFLGEPSIWAAYIHSGA